jgi:hypothetical protein
MGCALLALVLKVVGAQEVDEYNVVNYDQVGIQADDYIVHNTHNVPVHTIHMVQSVSPTHPLLRGTVLLCRLCCTNHISLL